MRISDLMESISKAWPFSQSLEFSDEGYFTRPEMSDDGSDNATGLTPSEIRSFLSSGWLPSLPGQYEPSTIDGYEGDDEYYHDENDYEPVHTMANASTSASSDGYSSIHEMTSYKIPGAFEASDSDRKTTDEGSVSDTRTTGDITAGENESLESQIVMHNPWRTLARFRNPMKQEEHSLYSRFPILHMPAELLMIVAEHLPIESVACLALACKTTYKALGTGSFAMPKPNLWRFLLLIEQERQNSYACCHCLKLHRPPEIFASFSSHKRCNRRRLLDIDLPRNISPGLVKLIGRKYFEDDRAFQEYLSWATMAAKKTCRHVKLSMHVVPRMVSGCLLLRTEIYIHPFHDGTLTERSFMELADQVGVDASAWYSQVPRLCSHQKWAEHLKHVATLKESIEPTNCVVAGDHQHLTRCYGNNPLQSAGQGLVPPIKGCALIHEQPCRACKPDPEGVYGGEIRGCRKCATDLAVSAREVPGVGHCVVLTSWKDIGGVGPGDADKWDRHVAPIRVPFDLDPDDCRTKRAIGRVYRAFENIPDERAKGESMCYRPRPDWKMVRDLTRQVHKCSYEADVTTDTEAATASEGDDDEDIW